MSLHFFLWGGVTDQIVFCDKFPPFTSFHFLSSLNGVLWGYPVDSYSVEIHTRKIHLTTDKIA